MQGGIFLLYLTTLVAISLAAVSYDKYKVISVIPQESSEVEILKKYELEQPFLDFWTSPSYPGSAVHIMVPPTYLDELKKLLQMQGISSEVFIENVQELIDNEKKGMKSDSEFGWTNYHTLEEIYAWLGSLPGKHPQVKLINAGSTYEGRNLTGVHVSYSASNSLNAVFMESNIHANEWIGSAVTTYMLNELLTSSDPVIRKLAESYDWYIVPVANPDGFTYAHNVDRMWRKTRRPYGECNGADPNRNWNNHWGEFGASTDPCSNNYAGPQVFSENCTSSMGEYLKTIGNKLVAYFDFHSYSQLLMIPYGYSPLPLDNYNVTYPIGLAAVKSLAKRYGTQYSVGTIYDEIYPASGGSIDWVKATFKPPLAYCYELRDTGKYGFILPPDQIIPSGQETLDSIVTILNEYEKTKP